VDAFVAADADLPPPGQRTIADTRAWAERARRARGGPAIAAEPVASVEDRAIPGPAGTVPVRIYTPDGADRFQALVFFHGGGWTLGDLDGSDAQCRALTNRVPAVVVSVDYRLAPEHKFPAGVEDCLAATRWVAENAAALRIDPGRIAVGGSSSGGNLAAVIALLARDQGGPPLAFQLLLYPVTDNGANSASWTENDGYILRRDSWRQTLTWYLRDEADRQDPYFAPLLAPDLRGLPPALVVTAEYDALRDEGEAYAARLREAGVPAQTIRYAGMVHGYSSERTLADISAALRTALGT
jgi:acetyl esterase